MTQPHRVQPNLYNTPRPENGRRDAGGAGRAAYDDDQTVLDPTEARQGSPRRMNFRVLAVSMALALVLGFLFMSAFWRATPSIMDAQTRPTAAAPSKPATPVVPTTTAPAVPDTPKPAP